MSPHCFSCRIKVVPLENALVEESGATPIDNVPRHAKLRIGGNFNHEYLFEQPINSAATFLLPLTSLFSPLSVSSHSTDVSGNDISERKRAELEKLQAQENLQLLMNNTDESFMMVGKDLQVLSYNAAATSSSK